MLLPPHDVFREQLTSLYNGHALWIPEPVHYEQVSIGDVGYVKDGFFNRMFNVLLEWDDPLNRTSCVPEQYTRLNMGPFVNIRRSRFSQGPYFSRPVTSQEANHVAALTDEYVVIVLS
jgi:hypothetical protein